MQPGEPVLAQPGRQALSRALGCFQPLAGIAVIADEMRELPLALRTGCMTVSFQNSVPSGR